jgi:hypothetical protein
MSGNAKTKQAYEILFLTDICIKLLQYLALPSGIPRNIFFLVGGGSTNSIEDRGQREWRSGGGSSLVRGSTQFANQWNPYSYYLISIRYDLFLTDVNYWHHSTKNIIVHLFTVLWFALHMTLCPCNIALLCSPYSLKTHLDMPILYMSHYL